MLARARAAWILPIVLANRHRPWTYARRERSWALAGIPGRTLLCDGSTCLGDNRVSDMTAVRRWSCCFDRDELRDRSFFRQDSLLAVGSRTQGWHSDWRCPRRCEGCAPEWWRLPLERQDISPKGACTRAGLLFESGYRSTMSQTSLFRYSVSLLNGRSQMIRIEVLAVSYRRTHVEVHADRSANTDRIDSPFPFRTLPDSSESFALSLSLSLSRSRFRSLFHAFLLDFSSSIKNWSSTVSLRDARSHPSSWTLFPPVPRWLLLAILPFCSCERSSTWTRSQSQTTHYSFPFMSSFFFSFPEFQIPEFCSLFLSFSIFCALRSSF